ncbi:MAG: hypothetical protein Q8T09_22080 [Candidatus Melainabacteria bacterium]|nr:hypothetical protein [Candidatus Melainabacteria bacterium]
MDLKAVKDLKVVQSYLNWLYLSPGKTDLIRRLTGVLAIPMLAIIWTWQRGGPGPINVPAWRIGGMFLEPPAPPEVLTNIVFVCACLAGLALLVGLKKKWLVALIFCTFVYYAPRDLIASSPHYIMLEASFLFALLLDSSSYSPTRRMIQISIFSCYFLSAVNKIINPAWMSGDSLWSIGFDVGMEKPFYSCLTQLPMTFWCVSSWLVAFWELAIAFALFSDRWRKWAIVTGILFHTAVCVVIEPVLLLFAAVMWVGWLAYLPAKTTVPSNVVPDRRYSTMLATLYLLVIFAVPLRCFFWSGRPVQLQSSFDRMPWSFHMFAIGSDKPETVTVRWKDSSAVWHDFPVNGRFKKASTDNEMYAIINYVFSTEDGVKEVDISLTNKIRNGQLMQHKSVNAKAPTFVVEPKVVISNVFSALTGR